MADTPSVVPNTLDAPLVRRALALLLAGGIIVVFDFTLRTPRLEIDFVNDTIGYLLIAISVFQLATQPGPPGYRNWIRFAQVGVVVSLVWSITQFSPGLTRSTPFLILSLVLLGLSLAATTAVCTAMRSLAAYWGLPRSRASWHVTTILVSLIWGGLWIFSVIVAATTGTFYYGFVGGSSHGILPALGTLIAGLTPGIFVLVSILTTRGELRSYRPSS